MGVLPANPVINSCLLFTVPYFYFRLKKCILAVLDVFRVLRNQFFDIFLKPFFADEFVKVTLGNKWSKLIWSTVVYLGT